MPRNFCHVPSCSLLKKKFAMNLRNTSCYGAFSSHGKKICYKSFSSLEKTIFHGYLSSLENTVRCKQSTRDNIQDLLLGVWLGVCLFLPLTLHYILYCVHCIVYTVSSIVPCSIFFLDILHCTLYSVFYTVYSVQ